MHDEDVRFTAAVSAAVGSEIPTGDVTFLDQNGDVLAIVPLDATGHASFALSLQGGAGPSTAAQEFGATYTGDGRFAPSSAVLTQRVLRPTSLALSGSPTPSLHDDEVTFTATVSHSPTLIPSGDVTFLDQNGDVLAIVPLDATGHASFAVRLQTGTHEIGATYAGDGAFAASGATTSHTVLPRTVKVAVEERVGVADDVVPMASAMVGIVETIGVVDDVVPLPSALVGITENIGVADAIVPLPSAMVSVPEVIGVADAVDADADNTPAGNAVVVEPNDAVVIVFTTVTSGGDTTAVTSSGPPAPLGLQPTIPPSSYEIGTTAIFVGPAEVCVTHPPNAVRPRLMHFTTGAWRDITTSSNAATNTVCGSATSFSPFAVFVPIPEEGRMTGHGTLPDGHQFEFRIAERSLGNERGALTFKFETPRAGKLKARTDQFKATAIDAIWFWDDPAYRGSRRPRPTVDSVVFTGAGRWNGVAGYSFEAEATDEGEPGRGRDSFRITVRDPQGIVVVAVDGLLTNGNIQSHRINQR
jgi:hypothetical protein